VNAITDEPANSDVDVRLAHRLAVMHDTAKQACEQVKNTIDAHEHMAIRNELS
jgi:hypothetical protein